MDMHEPGVPFAGAQGGVDGVLAGFSAGDEDDGRTGGRVVPQQLFEAAALGVVAVGDDDLADEPGLEEGLERMQEHRTSGQLGRDLIVHGRLHAPGRTCREQDQDVVGLAQATSPISRRIRRVSACGSRALRMGRPTTMKLAPAAAACAGVITRLWSSPAASG